MEITKTYSNKVNDASNVSEQRLHIQSLDLFQMTQYSTKIVVGISVCHLQKIMPF